jgi:hypothetical protein
MKFHYAEIVVDQRAIHRFPCSSAEIAERCARAFILDLFPEDAVMASVWDFSVAGPYPNRNDIGDRVHIRHYASTEKKSCGSIYFKRIGEK